MIFVDPIAMCVACCNSEMKGNVMLNTLLTMYLPVTILTTLCRLNLTSEGYVL